MNGKVIIDCELNTKSFDSQINEVESKLNDIEATLQMGEEDKSLFSTSEMKSMSAEAEKLRNKLISLNQQKAKVEQMDLKNVESSMKDINKSTLKIGETLNQTIKKVGKWALAVFGVRSAYMAVRKAMSILSQYDSQLATDIQYIQYALAKAIEPIVQKIVSLAYQLLGVIATIGQKVFGVNIFSNATAENFAKTNSEAQALKKTLTGFDEMNVLSDNSASSSSSSVGTPSVDLSAITEQDTSKIENFWETIFTFWDEGWLEFFATIDSNWTDFWVGIGLTVKGLSDVFSGVIDVIIGLVDFFIGVLTGDADKVLEGLLKMLNGLVGILKGVIEIALGLIVTVIGGIVDLFVNMGKWIYEKAIKPVGEFFSKLWTGMINGLKTAITNIKNAFTTLKNWISNIFSTIVDVFKNIGTKVGDVLSAAFKTVINTVLASVETVLNTPIKGINALLGVINKIPGIDLPKLNELSFPRLAVGGIVNQPGRGINYGGANIGERGAEGVIPLTNSQMMSELGQAIGKYITINASITNEMNGRVISRELQKINSSSDFAYNR